MLIALANQEILINYDESNDILKERKKIEERER